MERLSKAGEIIVPVEYSAGFKSDGLHCRSLGALCNRKDAYIDLGLEQVCRDSSGYSIYCRFIYPFPILYIF